MQRARIAGVGAALPERILSNSDLERIVDTSDEWITSRTGISTRRIAAEDQATSDLAHEAAARALDRAGVPASEIDLIIVATVTPDHLFPATASLVQDRLGATSAAAFDLSAGCSGFVYGLSLASAQIASGAADTVLVIGADTLSRIVDWTDRSTCVLFGDGAGAVVLKRSGDDRGILSTALMSDGSGGKLLVQPAGGSRMPASVQTVQDRLHTIHMNGNDVFKFAVRVVPAISDRALEKAGLSKDDIDWLIPHQANLRIIDAAARRYGLPPDKVVVNLDRYGNMSAASIPVAMSELVEAGRLSEGDICLMVAFGAGLTAAAAVMKW